MRSLGDLAWVNDYVGIPYKFGGRDWDGLDCYGLCKLVYKEEYNIILPDWATDKMDFSDNHKAIQSVVCSGGFEITETPSDGDFAVCYRHRASYHVGLFFGGGVLHANDSSGVIYEMKSQFDRNYLKVEYGIWTPG